MSHPPLKALFVFDCVMREQSFSLAAEALHVTPGAVGQQIRKLEDWLGAPLFERHIRQIEPTELAYRYWASIRPALNTLQEASAAARRSEQTRVLLSMPPSFASFWFARRMDGFLARHPEVQLHVSANAKMVDFYRDRVDLAVRYFDGRDAKLESRLLYADHPQPWCTRALRDQQGLMQPEDLRHTHLIHHALHPHWARWFAQFSRLTPTQIQAIPSLHFDQTVTAIEALTQGQGVMLVSDILLSQVALGAGLVAPFEDCQLALETGYYLVHPRQKPLSPAAETLKQWMLEVASAER